MRGGTRARQPRQAGGGQCAVVVKAFLASCSIVVLVTKATFGLGKKAVFLLCALRLCCSVPLVLFRAIVLLTSRVHECDYTGVQASIYCTALGGAPVGQQERNQGSSLLPSERRRHARGDGGGGTMEKRESLY